MRNTLTVKSLAVVALCVLFFGFDVSQLELPELVSVIVGFLAPLLIQVVKGRVESKRSRFLLALLLSSVVGVVSWFVSNPEEKDLINFVITTFAFSETAYMLFWRTLWQDESSALYRKKAK